MVTQNNFILFFSFDACCLQNVLKKEKSEIEEFFKDGISCCLPLDLAVSVKGLDENVRFLTHHILPILSFSMVVAS